MTHRTLPRALSLALALAVATLGLLLVPGSALAGPAKEGTTGTQESAKKPAASPSKAKQARASASKAKKSTPKAKPAKAHAKSDRSAPKPAKAKRTAARENKAAAKRAKAPSKADDSPAPGRTKPAAAPPGATKSGAAKPRAALPVTRVDAAVIARLDAIAKKLPGRKIEIVRGPGQARSEGSAHEAGRALDLRVDGVDAAKVAEICRTLPDTGCGYYPNAAFVHVDARAAGSGKSSWIDAAEPGEPPRYVTSWPPPAAETTTASPQK